MKCVLILPYFGRFKNYFELFLKSCACNPQTDWLLFTDCTESYPYPENFRVIHTSFEEFRARIQKEFDFQISLERPYKLCDFRPAFGYLCGEEIRGYDYWGYCDCDLIFGDLSSLQPLLERGYDKLFAAGHLALYKNTPEINRVFLDEMKGVGRLYRTAFTNPQPYNFDEVYFKYSVYSLFAQRGLKLYTRDGSYNCSTKHRGFCRKTFDEKQLRWIEEKGKNDQIYWKDGKVFRLSAGAGGAVERQEFLYIHLQQRTMEFAVDILDARAFQITPDGFAKASDLPETAAELRRRQKFYPDIPGYRYKLLRFRRKLLGRQRPKWDTPWKYSPYGG